MSSRADASRSRRHRRRDYIRDRLDVHWTRMVYFQLAAMVLVLILWVLPIPNPIKLIAVAMHELSHALMAVLTGGSVFGIALVPSGAGVTIGMGGHLPAILAAGYIGSVLFGALLYYVSIKWKPRYALFALVGLIFSTAALGWLSNETAVFSLGSLLMMALVFAAPVYAQLFFLRLVGSACCLYAPLDMVTDWVRSAGPPSVLGEQTASDVTQLAALTQWHPAVVAGGVLIVQLAILVALVRWSCTAGAKSSVRHELRSRNEDRHMRKQLQHDLHPEDKRYRLR
jgi:hypothetical protein